LEKTVNDMDKKRALFHAIVTAIIVSIIIGITACCVYGIALLMEILYDAGFHLLTFIAPLLLVVVIVAIKAYRYFRKEG
jgi:phosphotransferase system  glucose/maltose/N-acetylglucosamine-specific IIC component